MTATARASPRPLRLPRLSATAAQACTQLARAVQGSEVLPAGEEWLLTLEPRCTEPPAWSARDWTVRAQWAGARFALRLPALAPDLWVRQRFPDLDLPNLPPAYATAVLEESLAEALAALAGLRQGAARIDALEPGDAALEPDLDHALWPSLANGGWILHGVLYCDTLGLLLLGGAAAALPPAPSALAEDELPVRLRAEIGRSTLARDVLAGLQVHDVILIAQPWLGAAGELWLAVAGAAGLGLRVRWEPPALTLLQPLTRAELATNPDIPADALADPVDLDALPVQLIPYHCKRVHIAQKACIQLYNTAPIRCESKPH